MIHIMLYEVELYEAKKFREKQINWYGRNNYIFLQKETNKVVSNKWKLQL